MIPNTRAKTVTLWLKGHWHEKSVSNKHLAFQAFHVSRYYIQNFSDRPFKSYDFSNVLSIEENICLLMTPDRRLFWYSVRGSPFDSFPECSCPIFVVCGLLPGENNLPSGCHLWKKRHVEIENWCPARALRNRQAAVCHMQIKTIPVLPIPTTLLHVLLICVLM
jgi:hypothetical protein